MRRNTAVQSISPRDTQPEQPFFARRRIDEKLAVFTSLFILRDGMGRAKAGGEVDQPGRWVMFANLT
ncbi:hypothetical protein ISM_08640 [Roseovarius nubinhibens ISM]|uniref:Uncharacterized protein n=1 Tax=Roseovarius nubinhibens (strain ATCC BAA-591 / DSM 15170 / ISM) TaxID=89187 RepID=A3SLX0_ROSNI|nr:hypothetical protein ISM_08640 [Roseovarius nubinhibens ISM]